MVWYWKSYWENRASDWRDFESYSATSRVAWRKKEDAERAANAHERRTGRATNVYKDDGRRWRGKIRG